MKRLAAILLLAGCAYAPAPKNGDPADAIWSFYADGVDDAEVSVAIVRDGVPVFAGDPKAIYRIGSLTDFFVVEAARRIADRGEIDLDRPLTAFARFAVDPLYGKVSMRELAELRCDPIDSDNSLAFAVDRFRWVSDARTALFAALLEDAVGKTVAEIVRDEIAMPLLLRETSFNPSPDKCSRIATRGESFEGLYSSVEDCVKFFSSSERVRSSVMLLHRKARGVMLDYSVGRIFGGRRFLAYPEGRRDFLLIFRNVTSWSQYKDFEFASEVFAE